MIKLIEGKAYLKDITNPEQSLEMFEYLQSHPEIELYLIEGKNKYGCGDSGDLVAIERMPIEKLKNGFCVNPFYAEFKPTAEPTGDVSTPSGEISITQETPLVDTTECLKQCEPCKDKLLEVETALENSIKERDMFVNLYNENKSELETITSQFESKITYLESEYNNSIDKVKELEEKLVSASSDENKIKKTDIRGLCKALYDLGFDVELGFVDNKE